ncbi:MAG: radical SAM protein [Myxococcales bacterium]|nr:MAG: radical SAM protein [Myxococcales bacterium]
MTTKKLRLLKSIGVNKLSYGIQSFDNEQLRISGRNHTGDEAVRVYEDARKLGFDRISGDLIYGLPGQSVASFLNDVKRCVDLGLDTIVVTKLHLLSFKETNTAIAGIAPSAWESAARRKKVEEDGHRWPSLGEVYQMREEAVKILNDAGYDEHPTMYFQKKETGPERWKAIMVDQDKQFPDIGIGLGASQQNDHSTASVETHPKTYSELIEQGRIPFGSIRGFDEEAEKGRFLQMALSACEPVSAEAFEAKFSEPLFSLPMVNDLKKLEKHGLLTVDTNRKIITLTETGKTLVEAIIHIDLSDLSGSKGRGKRSLGLLQANAS